MTYEELLNEVDSEGILIFENNHIGKLDGLYVDGTITLNTRLENDTQKKCTLVEELGHHKRTYGNILDQSKVENRKQERYARAWGYRKLVDPLALINAKKEGIRNMYELAEHLGVEEMFLENVLKYYKEKFGNRCPIGDYVLQFEPLEVYENVYEKIFEIK